ncbi:MAG: clostripain-related cysteine peptidase [Spirochaetota bacterium]
MFQKTRLKMFFRTLVVGIAFSMCAFSCGGGGSSSGGGGGVVITDPSVTTTKNWTIIVYLDGDNNLEQAALTDLNEMEAVNLTGSSINVITLFDRAPAYYTSSPDWTGTRIYEVAYDSAGSANEAIVSKRLGSTSLGIPEASDVELNMGDPQTLSKYIDYCKTYFPATNYALILWNHGGGWKNKNIINNIKSGLKTLSSISEVSILKENKSSLAKAVCWDDTNGDDTLYMSEVKSAVAGKGLSIIGFDACLMGMIEVAYELKDNASYMIASEETIPGDGWNYEAWLTSFKDSVGKTADDMCNAIVDSYGLYYITYSGTTLSALDLSKVSDVYSALNTFSESLYNAISTDTIRDNVFNTIWNDVEYYCAGYSSDYNIDLWHLADRIQNTYTYTNSTLHCTALKTAIEGCIVKEWHNTSGTIDTGNPNSHGLAIHFTYINSSGYGGNMWYDYCNGYSSTYPVDFVQDANNNWVAHYSGSSIVGPGLLYRLWRETLP